MADPRAISADSRAEKSWAFAAFALAATAMPVALALLGQARLGPAAAGAAGLAALWLTLRLTSRRAPPAASATPRTVAREPPFAAIFEQLVDPILLVAGGDPHDLGDRRFLVANAAARELLRLTRPDGPLTAAVRAPEVLAAVEDALFGRDQAEAVYQSRGPQERFWRVRALPLASGDQAIGPAALARLALLSFRDETEIRRGERTRADFLANASHELRTPLASLAGFIETLRGHARDDGEARERFLGIMHLQAERMRRLLDDLMSLSRIELGEHIPPSGSVDIALATTDVLDALGPLAAAGCVALRPSLPPRGSAVAIGDRDQILQVIQNLAENAVKYTPRDATVTVTVLAGLRAIDAATPTASPPAAHLSLLTPSHAAEQRYVALRVRDQGVGIARSNLPRLTERFYRVEGQKTRERPGTGLGLAIVKHIVNRHRGGLTVESAPGAGATFTAYFPMAPAAQATPEG